MEVCRLQEAHHGFGWAAVKHNIVFYSYYGQIAGCNPIWVYATLKSMVRMFERVELQTNLGRIKAMV